MSVFTASLLVAFIVCLLVLWMFIYLWRRSLGNLRDLRSSSQSRSTRYGQMTEQFMPFIPEYPWDPGRFRFIGSPVDGVQFEDELVVFIDSRWAPASLRRGSATSETWSGQDVWSSENSAYAKEVPVSTL